MFREYKYLLKIENDGLIELQAGSHSVWLRTLKAAAHPNEALMSLLHVVYGGFSTQILDRKRNTEAVIRWYSAKNK